MLPGEIQVYIDKINNYACDIAKPDTFDYIVCTSAGNVNGIAESCVQVLLHLKNAMIEHESLLRNRTLY
jgi:hypothetical protein